MIITLNNCSTPECEGASHRWEFERPTLREIQRIETTTGLDAEQFFAGMDSAGEGGITSVGIKAILALVDVLHRRDGVRAPFEDIDVDIVDFAIEFEAGEVDEDESPVGDEDEVGKGPAPTSPSPPPSAPEVEASASGDATEAASPRRSPDTPPGSGGGTA